MNNRNFARMLGVPSPANVMSSKKKERNLDVVLSKPGFAKIFKSEQPCLVNHSPLAWQVRARGLVA